jgi:hypothetical protein
MPSAVLAGEAIGPPDLLQMRRARRVIGEKTHEIRERRWEREPGEHGAKTIADLLLGSNRISML